MSEWQLLSVQVKERLPAGSSRSLSQYSLGHAEKLLPDVSVEFLFLSEQTE